MLSAAAIGLLVWLTIAMKPLVLLALVVVGGCVPDLWPVALPMVRAPRLVIPTGLSPAAPVLPPR